MHLVDLLFSFHGRINRQQYWLASICVGLLGAVLTALSVPMFSGADKSALLHTSLLSAAFSCIVSLLAGWAGLAIQVKRFHDRGQTGWFALAPLVPIFSILWSVFDAIANAKPAPLLLSEIMPMVLVLFAINLAFFINLGCLAGDRGPNRFDRPPPAVPGAPPAGKAGAAKPSAPEAFALSRAMEAVERAAAAHAAASATPAAATPRPSSGGFGRRPAR